MKRQCIQAPFIERISSNNPLPTSMASLNGKSIHEAFSQWFANDLMLRPVPLKMSRQFADVKTVVTYMYHFAQATDIQTIQSRPLTKTDESYLQWMTDLTKISKRLEQKLMDFLEQNRETIENSGRPASTAAKTVKKRRKRAWKPYVTAVAKKIRVCIDKGLVNKIRTAPRVSQPVTKVPESQQ